MLISMAPSSADRFSATASYSSSCLNKLDFCLEQMLCKVAFYGFLNARAALEVASFSKLHLQKPHLCACFSVGRELLDDRFGQQQRLRRCRDARQSRTKTLPDARHGSLRTMQLGL